MSDLSTRAFRIVPPDPGSAPVAAPPPAHAGTGFDYAGLAEKARATREARAASRRRREPGPGRDAQARVAGSRTGATPEPGPQDTRAESDALALDAPEQATGSGAAGADIGDDEALGAEVAQAAWPVVNEVSRVADAFAVMLVSLAREIAAFCAVPSISQGGQWEAHVPLDERNFPHTTLHLGLSPFALSLRFDCRDPTVRQLLCDHEAALKRELAKLMDAWGEPRVIEISAW